MTAASPKRIELTVSGDPARPFSVEGGARRLRAAAGTPGGESASMADSKELARPVADDGCPLGYIRGPEAQVPLRHASGSRDTQAPFRTLTGVRFRPDDESASLIDCGAL